MAIKGATHRRPIMGRRRWQLIICMPIAIKKTAVGLSGRVMHRQRARAYDLRLNKYFPNKQSERASANNVILTSAALQLADCHFLDKSGCSVVRRARAWLILTQSADLRRKKGTDLRCWRFVWHDAPGHFCVKCEWPSGFVPFFIVVIFVRVALIPTWRCESATDELHFFAWFL